MENLMINLDDNGFIYDKIYTAIREGILDGEIAGGERLPSKRRLANQLGISVNSVDTAYQILLAEGYIISKERSGFYACTLTPQPKTSQNHRGVSIKNTDDNRRYNFATSGIDKELFPYKLWCRIEREVSSDSMLLNHGERQGDHNLRVAVCEYLRGYRGISCKAEELIIGAGMEYLLCMLARLFEGETLAVENPGYARVSKVFSDFGVNIKPLSVDSEGLSISELKLSTIDLAYVTPSCQFPTGVIMPATRRHDIMNWALQKESRYIIEDDYNSEFRFSTRPIPSLRSQDTAGRVIHLGTFSKSVAPSLRIAYILLPPDLFERWQERYGGYACTVSRFEQQALYRFISKGHFSRHINRLRTAYKKRQEHLICELKRLFGKKIEVYPSDSGLHILARFLLGLSTDEIKSRAAEEGILIHALDDFYMGEDRVGDDRIILGYSNMDESCITEALEKLYEVMHK